MHLTKRHRVWGMRMEDVGVLWAWRFYRDSHKFLWVWMGMRIEIQSPRQPIWPSIRTCKKISVKILCFKRWKRTDALVRFYEAYCLR